MIVCNEGDDKKDGPENDTKDGAEYISGTSFMVWN